MCIIFISYDLQNTEIEISVDFIVIGYKQCVLLAELAIFFFVGSERSGVLSWKSENRLVDIRLYYRSYVDKRGFKVKFTAKYKVDCLFGR